MAPFDVWNTFCDDNAFQGAEYNSTFTRRLYDLRKQFKAGKSRADDDIEAFEIAKANHLVPAFNHRGEPQWNGSAAQKLLKEDMKDNKHFDLKPEHLWETRKEYQLFELTTFRDHIHQEHKTAKYIYTLQKRAKDKEEARKKEAIEKQKKDKEKTRKDAEKAAAKARKEAEKAAAKARKDAEKTRKAKEQAAAKANREAEKASKKSTNVGK